MISIVNGGVSVLLLEGISVAGEFIVVVEGGVVVLQLVSIRLVGGSIFLMWLMVELVHCDQEEFQSLVDLLLLSM